MIERACALVAVILLLSLSAAPRPSPAAAAAEQGTIKLGYVELADDARYARGEHSGIVFTDQGRPYPGSRVALDDARAVGRVVGIEFAMAKATGKSVDELAQRILRWMTEEGVHFVLADLPAAALKDLAHRLSDHAVVLFNISAPDDSLRGSDCAKNVFHTYPSQAMLSDALAQFLVARGWPQILVLQGPAPEDAATVAALQRSARKFRLEIVATRPFLLTNDPRNREQTNIRLLTGGVGYDVVFVADSSGEFARYVAYETGLPRPVVGSAGLVPTAWSWSWDRDAAVQLQHRFEKMASPRRMNGADWAAWEAVKAVTQAVLRTHSTDFAALTAFLSSDRLTLDTVKGNPGSFRAWDHQLRAPILLGTADAVIERAPLPQYLHQTNVLDTLGLDRPETACDF
jgi:ABC transporter substrate binding protein (PQQ-dependent alcohol dehydrogenase system)